MFWTVVPVVLLVIVLAVALVSAGADTYDYIRWGYFQQPAPTAPASPAPPSAQTALALVHYQPSYLIPLLS